jgi:plastocyanin
MISLKVLFTTIGFGLHASAATIKITAGGTGLYFSPTTTTAAKGDVLEFHFVPRNHSVVAGDFNNPCQPAAAGGFFSGFVPVDSGESVSLSQRETPDDEYLRCFRNQCLL